MSDDRCADFFRRMPNAKYTQGDFDWATSIMNGWKDARYMTTGEYGERNVFDDEPDFVTKAQDVLAFWEEPRLSAIADRGMGRSTANILFRMRFRSGKRMTKVEMQDFIRKNAENENARELALDVLRHFLDELAEADNQDLSRIEAKYKLHLERYRG